MSRLIWLADVLRGAGLKVAEQPGWQAAGRGEMGMVAGIVCHHTGTANPARRNMPTLGVLSAGRSDLPGPLSQLGLGLDGTFYVVAAGRANHAGAGAWAGVTGNSRFIGIEGENSGGEPWPEVQMDAYRRGVAALLARLGLAAGAVCGHKEYAPRRKWDPTFDMDVFRGDVGAILAGTAAVRPPLPANDDAGRPTLRRGATGDAVRLVQTAAGLAADGVFGAATEAAVRRWQRAHALVPDGIVGPASWAAIGAAGLAASA